MQIKSTALLLGLLLGSTVSIAHAQTVTPHRTIRAKIPRATAIDPIMHVDPALHPANSAVVQNALTYKPVNGGSEFQLICRGGTGLRIWSDYGTANPNQKTFGSEGPYGYYPLYMAIDFNPGTQPPDHAGLNLQPGQCSPADFVLQGLNNPTQIRQDISGDGSVPGFNSLPAEKQLTADLKAQGRDDRRDPSVRIEEFVDYLKDTNNYWSFEVHDAGELSDTGDGYFIGGGSYWKPEFYKPPSKYEQMQARQVAPGARNAAAAAHAAIFASAPVAPPAPPAQQPPAAPPPVAPPPAEPGRAFVPPTFDDGAQLWACANAVQGKRKGTACSGVKAGKTFCRAQGFSGALQARADGAPDLLVAAAQPGIPVRAVNGDACTANACVAISELHCAP